MPDDGSAHENIGYVTILWSDNNTVVMLTVEKYDRGIADECNGNGKFTFVAARVSGGRVCCELDEVQLDDFVFDDTCDILLCNAFEARV